MRPKPPSTKDVPRQKLSLDFAALLMRSSYVETAQLEIGPVNQLERDMYLVRTAEYEPYLSSVNGPVQQGDITDPYYFDFMSFVQYVTINRALKDPETEYDQQEPITGEGGLQSTKFDTVHVKRTLPDDVLVATHEQRVGTAILNFLTDRFGGTPAAVPTTAAAFDGDPQRRRPENVQVLQQALTKLVNLFLISGFAWEGKAELIVKGNGSSRGKGTTTFLLTLENPATLWSAQCLARQRAPLRNDFLLKTAKELVKSMGYEVASSSVKVEGNKELSYLTVQ
jgi:hypothetical protein